MEYTLATCPDFRDHFTNRPKGNWDYAYDELDQLLSATNLDDATLTQSFTYDEAGNMTYNSALGSYSYPAATAPRPHAPTDVAGQALTYDNNGNMLSGMGRTTTYVYGPDDKRLKKITGGVTTLYLGNDEEHLSDGTVIKHIDGTVRRVGSVSNWIQRDHLSSIRLMTDTTGTQIAENRYRPYGERTDVQLAVNTPRESRGWIGERDDPETGLTYLNTRYYDPALGRFITPDWFDPTDRGVGTNRYAYGMNNPIMLKDPSGNRVSDVGPLGRLGGDEANTAYASLQSNISIVPGDDIERDVSGAGGEDRFWDEEDERYAKAIYGRPLDCVCGLDLNGDLPSLYGGGLGKFGYKNKPKPWKKDVKTPPKKAQSDINGRLTGSFLGMSTKFVLKNIPKGWKKLKATRGNGWKLVDKNGVERIRFMRPAKKRGLHVWGRLKSGYWRRQDGQGNFLALPT